MVVLPSETNWIFSESASAPSLRMRTWCSSQHMYFCHRLEGSSQSLGVRFKGTHFSGRQLFLKVVSLSFPSTYLPHPSTKSGTFYQLQSRMEMSGVGIAGIEPARIQARRLMLEPHDESFKLWPDFIQWHGIVCVLKSLRCNTTRFSTGVGSGIDVEFT